VDVLYLLVAVGFFAGCWALIWAFQRL
jgi:hypothetical protein